MVLCEMSKDELFTWVADLLVEMFELDRDALTLKSKFVFGFGY